MTTGNEEPKEDAVVDKNRVTLSGRELIILVIFTPVVFTWLFLAARIIISATTSVAVLDSIEGLLTALAVLTIPVSAGVSKLFEGWGNNDGKE
jgi:energy-coupling factor transporter transmembrane protein EcfT